MLSPDLQEAVLSREPLAAGLRQYSNRLWSHRAAALDPLMRGDLLRSTGRGAFPSGSSSRKYPFSQKDEKSGRCQRIRGFEHRENSLPSRSGVVARQNLHCFWVAGFEPRALLANPAKPRASELSDRFQKVATRHHAGSKLPIQRAVRERARATPEPNFASARERRTRRFGRLASATMKIRYSQSENVPKSDWKPADWKPRDS